MIRRLRRHRAKGNTKWLRGYLSVSCWLTRVRGEEKEAQGPAIHVDTRIPRIQLGQLGQPRNQAKTDNTEGSQSQNNTNIIMNTIYVSDEFPSHQAGVRWGKGSRDLPTHVIEFIVPYCIVLRVPLRRSGRQDEVLRKGIFSWTIL